MTQEIITQISETVGTEVFGIWFLIGAAFVFFMQAGFAMVETGFTRAKNAGNIIMKNLMDFCIGTVVFIFLGFGLLLGEDALGGFIGLPTLGIFTDYANFDWSNFVFNLVFCATAATIVSGAMAERTKFLSYCIYSGVISAVVYPIEAHWIWGGGWLAQMGFHDFAGSAAIHTVGGLTAFIGAAMVGPRIGKFSKDKNGTVTKVHAFPGHNLVIGALGCSERCMLKEKSGSGRRESKRQDWMRGICWNLSQVWIRHIIIWSRIAGWNKAWHRNMKKW